MIAIQARLTNPFTLTKLSPGPTLYTINKWDSSFLKKFITEKWPFEVYKDSLLHDFWSVFSSKI